MNTLPLAIFVMGPTASGKTGLAVELARRWPLELISVDSALVYHDMNIGTAKPDATTLAAAPHALIDKIDPTESYSAAQFCADAIALMTSAVNDHKIPLLVGGTMLYFNSLQHGINNLPQSDPALRDKINARAQQHGWPALHAELAQYDPASANRLQPNDAQRIERALEIYFITGQAMSTLLNKGRCQSLPYRLLKIALQPSDRAVLHQRIADRFDQMLKSGLVEEVRALRQSYPELTASMPAMRCVGYRQAWQYIEGELSQAELREKGIAATRQLAKRQMTWLRGMDDIIEVDCLDPLMTSRVEHLIGQFIEENQRS